MVSEPHDDDDGKDSCFTAATRMMTMTAMMCSNAWPWRGALLSRAEPPGPLSSRRRDRRAFWRLLLTGEERPCGFWGACCRCSTRAQVHSHAGGHARTHTHGRTRTDTLDAISVASPPGAIHVRSRSDRLWTVAFEITSRESGKTYLTSHPAAGAKSVYLSVSVLRERACLGDVTRALPLRPR